MRLAGASTIDQANDFLQEFLPRFNARFAVTAEHPEKAYRPVAAELSLTETICIKHPRKVVRDNTVKYHWRVRQLLPGMDRPSYAGLRVEVLERADGELMISYHGETVDFQESAQPLSALWGSANPCSVGPELQPVADDPANGHLNQAQRTLLDSLEPPDEEEVSAKRVVAKGSVGNGKSVRHSLHRTPTQAQQERWVAVQQARGAGILPAGHSPEVGHVPGGHQKVRLGGKPTHQTTQRQGACQGRGSGRIIDRSGLARVTFSLSNEGDIIAGQQHSETKEAYKQRKQPVEPLFGIIKEQMGVPRFLLRGLINVAAEWTALATAFNLPTLWQAWRSGAFTFKLAGRQAQPAS